MTEKRKHAGDDTPILEWIAGTVGFILFATAIWMTLANGFSPSAPPNISITLEPASAASGGFRVEFEVTNQGDQTASAVIVQAELRSGEMIIERHDVTLDFLPPRSTVRAGVFLKHDPNSLDLDIRASSYRLP